MTRQEEFGAVRDGNRPRRATTRPDPDTPTAAPAHDAPATPPPPGNSLAPQEGGTLLASKLASKQGRTDGDATGQAGSAGVASPTLTVRQMLQLRRPRTDPFSDWVADGTRMLSWLQDAVALVAAMTNRTRQEVVRDAMLGVQPLPGEILDETFQDRFGYPRPPAPHQ